MNQSFKVFCQMIGLATVLSGAVCLAAADDNSVGLVNKQTFSTHDFQTFNGSEIPVVNIGWEAYGELNANKDNVILITHFFSGNSHAAGRYTEDDALPGYWDSIIGPGKAIDTNRYYVISSDTLVNQEPHNPLVTTTGPASINPSTGEPYGLDFPVVTIRDFVNVQKALLDSLGISRLHAVIGASMGSLQALDWATAYPDFVERVISVIGGGAVDPWTIATLQQWANPILADPNWNNGDYYGGEAPLAGLRQALGMVTLQAMHPLMFNQLYAASGPGESAPLHDIRANFTVVDQLNAAADARTTFADANHVLYLVRANQLFMAGFSENLRAGLSRVSAKTLFLPASNDLLLQPYLARTAHETLMELGKTSYYEEIDGPWGHLDGVYLIDQKAELIEQFLSTD
ncbi:E22 family MetX-like putative esterase [Pseudohongiella spirulinae]|uniref:Probable acyltransferase n=1 Tax=Pseudohongiella spirulinae TaxID=1249552 RepID=A0A0S2KET8_9GAMM|nr:homoserine O-acetyltransferase [Pseudohongiella spirulinae]ALO46840.1 Homoserine O-acetyltransferase [Pseudohongiella spirulinae]